jgi:arylsulfatase A-like enzyme
VLKSAGYTTGVVGKWHLGLGSVHAPADWNGDIKPSPLDIGFDSMFIMAATGDRVPCVYVKDRRVVGLDPADPIRVDYQKKIGDEPTGRENPELLKMKLTQGHDMTIVNGISRIGWMKGGKSARWVDEEMGDVFAREAVRFVEGNKDKPFFLFFATHEPHVPRVPHPRFVGTSGMGPRGDAIHHMDWAVGEVLAALDRLKLAEDTLVIFTSDNGPVLDDGYADEAVEKLGDHKPAGPFRGTKYTPYEGGTRVPFVVRWPAKVKAGTTSDALVCQIDFLRSLGKLAGATVPADAGPDSEDVLAALLGDSPKGRTELVEQARRMAYRKGTWKLIEAAGARPRDNATVELYDLATDPGEKNNLAAQRPELVKELTQELRRIRQREATAAAQ